MVTEGRESILISRDRAVGGESWSTTSSHRGASTKKKRFVAPICHCGTYAILFESSPQINPNRLFLGKGSHCKYFAWLDEYLASGHSNEGSRAPEEEDPMKNIEEKMISLEKMMTDLSNRKRDIVMNHCKGISIFVLGILFAFCLSLGLS
ncbi:hypothetical protein PIB30_101691 [Stylosanthes scabra]|uniref:Zinc finger GRF-type domain-containing protein n=1 Tax=Stylosanthes scabra TaxID=79078 RepID=A0ABU6WVS0_9FABA|nr:hypothetical protein [Stylosanthes scabra]